MTDKAWVDTPRHAPTYRVHPALGMAAVALEDGSDIEPPQSWRELPYEQQDAIYESWSRALLEAIAQLGDSEIWIDLSDGLGEGRLSRVAGCEKVAPKRYRCEASKAAIDAVLETNPGRLIQTVAGEVALYLSSDWDHVWLYIDAPELRSQFGAASATQ